MHTTNALESPATDDDVPVEVVQVEPRQQKEVPGLHNIVADSPGLVAEVEKDKPVEVAAIAAGVAMPHEQPLLPSLFLSNLTCLAMVSYPVLYLSLHDSSMS